MCLTCIFFFFNDTATTEIYPLSLHDALPISKAGMRIFDDDVLGADTRENLAHGRIALRRRRTSRIAAAVNECTHGGRVVGRSEEHTSELQSRQYLVCRLLLEKKKKNNLIYMY